MRIPITPEGWSVIAVSTVVLAAIGFVSSFLTPWAWIIVTVVWLWAISFFRDPQRVIDRHPTALYSPADGKVTRVEHLEDHPLIGRPCVRIRIFLSIFDVHVNRMPCAASIAAIEHQPGKFLNAMRPQSAELNESNTLMLDPYAPVGGPLVVRQIVGMIARTIVCRVAVGDQLASGERFGMIKFGSGTELVIPQQDGLQVLTHVGARVRAGLTAVARIEL